MSTDHDHLLELLFTQSLDGFFFMMLDDPIRWEADADKEALLDYVFAHQRITRVNDAMLAHYGATPDTLIGMTPADLYAHDPAEGRRVWREFFDRGRLHIQTHERRRDGTPIDIEGDYICLYDNDRRIIGHFGIQRDVTEQVRLQLEVAQHAAQLERRVAERTDDLVRSENRIHAILNALPDLVFVIDREGRYLAVTHAGEHRVRASPELLTRQVDDLVPSSAASPLLAEARKTIETGRVHVLEYPVDTTGGSRWFEARTAPLHAAVEQAACVVIVRDVTDRKRADELASQNLYLREAFDADLQFGDIVGRSGAMQAVFRAIELVARTDSSVLLLGETGTGKELIARAIHRLSRRSGAPLVKLNCGALPITLVESELFGHERGAFTGAVQQKKGRFELAHRGTILLDEVGDLPLEVQVKLLRVLQEQEFERVGGTQTLRVDARVIAATNRDLAAEVVRRTFRSDLYFRLNIFPIRVPSLRDRRDDIPLLARHFIAEFSARMGRSVDRIDAAALEQLTAYDWPGNVRELANILERAVILCPGRVLQLSHLGLPDPSPPRADGLCTLEESERRHILRALDETRGVLGGPNGAARLLGVNRSTLWSRMKKLGIQPPAP
jgi:PAS domain S-box-containing protein